MANSIDVDSLYLAALGQIAAESYLDGISLAERDAIFPRLTNGNNRHPDDLRPSLNPNVGAGGTRFVRDQRDEFFSTFDIIDHLPNQSSGFSTTLLKNRITGEYTLAFRSTEYRSIEYGGDAERDSAGFLNPGLQPCVQPRVAVSLYGAERVNGVLCLRSD
jgi:hypothetical protein